MGRKDGILSVSIVLTERDLEIMRWINGHGFVGIKHAAQFLNLSIKSAYKCLLRLTQNKFLIHQKVLHGQPGVYVVTKKGVQIIADDLPPLKNIKLATYRHDLLLVDLSLYLLHIYGGDYVAERRLRHTYGLRGFGVKGHISDGELYLNNKCFAIELELSSKGKLKRESILKYYTRHFEYDELWYFYETSRIKQQLLPLLTKRPFVKLFSIQDILKVRSDKNEKHIS